MRRLTPIQADKKDCKLQGSTGTVDAILGFHLHYLHIYTTGPVVQTARNAIRLILSR